MEGKKYRAVISPTVIDGLQRLIISLMEESESSAKKYTQWLQERELIKTIQVDFLIKEVYYHQIYKVRYQNQARLTLLGLEESKKMSSSCTMNEKHLLYQEGMHIKELLKH